VVVDYRRAVQPPAAAVGDPAEFLDVQVHQIARTVTLYRRRVRRDARITAPVTGSSSNSLGSPALAKPAVTLSTG